MSGGGTMRGCPSQARSQSPPTAPRCCEAGLELVLLAEVGARPPRRAEHRAWSPGDPWAAARRWEKRQGMEPAGQGCTQGCPYTAASGQCAPNSPLQTGLVPAVMCHRAHKSERANKK